MKINSSGDLENGVRVTKLSNAQDYPTDISSG